MVNIMYNTIRGAYKIATVILTNIWDLVAINWENDTNNWEA